METQTQVIESTEKEEKTVIFGAAPFLSLRQLCLDERVKFAAIAKTLFNNTPSANRAFWVFCNNEQKKIAAGGNGYTLSHERIFRLAEIGIACEVYIEGGSYKTASWIANRPLFEKSIYKYRKLKKFVDK